MTNRLAKFTPAALLSMIVIVALTRSVAAWPPKYDHWATAARRPADDPATRRPVDLVICLDTSGSMTELIDSARMRLWDVVNQLSHCRPTPQLRVGLLTYGTPENSRPESGWIVRQCDLTDNLDAVYSKMMSMSTSGGDEFVGWVLNDAVNTMSWSPDPKSLRIVFVAGNESADQASERYNFRYVGESARGRGIKINAIYAGDRNQGMAERWHEVAACGGGNFSAIDMRCGTIQISTPYDDVLNRLNTELNGTYLPCGPQGAFAQANQAEQDANALKLGVQSCASRVAAKATALYENAGWDLVDASKKEDFDLETIPAEELPDAMREMAGGERHRYLDDKVAARGDIQRRIQEVAAQRDQFLAEARAKQSAGVSLDDAMLKDLREQAVAAGFEFEGGQ